MKALYIEDFMNDG